MGTRGQEAQGCQVMGRSVSSSHLLSQAFLFKDTQGHFNHQTPRTEPLWQVTLTGNSHWHRVLDLISNPTESLSDTHGNQSYSLSPGTAARLPALQQPPGLAGEQACAKGTKTQKNKSGTWLEGSSIREYSVTPANSSLQCQAGSPTCWSRNVPKVAIPWGLEGAQLRDQCPFQKKPEGWGCSSGLECLPTMPKARGSNPAQEEKAHLPLGSGKGSL